MNIVCCQLEVTASGRSLAQRSPTDCGTPNECDRENLSGAAITRNQVEAPQGKNMTQTLINVNN